MLLTRLITADRDGGGGDKGRQGGGVTNEHREDAKWRNYQAPQQLFCLSSASTRAGGASPDHRPAGSRCMCEKSTLKLLSCGRKLWTHLRDWVNTHLKTATCGGSEETSALATRAAQVSKLSCQHQKQMR